MIKIPIIPSYALESIGLSAENKALIQNIVENGGTSFAFCYFDKWTLQYRDSNSILHYCNMELDIKTIGEICFYQNLSSIDITQDQLQLILNQAKKTLESKNKIPYSSWRTLCNITTDTSSNDSIIIFNAGDVQNPDNYFIITNYNTFIVELTPKFVQLLPFTTKLPLTTTKNQNERNPETMNINASTINFECGPITNGAVVLSPYGLAIKAHDKLYTYNVATKQIVDVTDFTFDIKGIIYKLPAAIKDVRPGDMILHQGKPMYVTNVNDASVEAIDIINAESKNIVPVTNMFGFNFVTKIVSLMNLPTTAPSADQPFGNLMPMMMMSAIFGDNDNPFGDSDFGKFIMLSTMTGTDNPFAKIFNLGAPIGPASTETK